MNGTSHTLGLTLLSGPNQTCQFHTVNRRKCTSDSPYDLKCKGCQFPLNIFKIFEKVRYYHHFGQLFIYVTGTSRKKNISLPEKEKASRIYHAQSALVTTFHDNEDMKL